MRRSAATRPNRSRSSVTAGSARSAPTPPGYARSGERTGGAEDGTRRPHGAHHHVRTALRGLDDLPAALVDRDVVDAADRPVEAPEQQVARPQVPQGRVVRAGLAVLGGRVVRPALAP